jgi:hypothetical protein
VRRLTLSIVSAAAALLASRRAGADRYTLSDSHRFELGVHSGFALSNPGVVRVGEDTVATAVVGIDARFALWPLLAVGGVVQTTTAYGDRPPVQDALANVWFRLPVSTFRPWVTFGFGVLRSSITSAPAADLGFGIDWCLDRAVDRYACRVILTVPGILITEPTHDTRLALTSFFLRVAFQP